MNLSLIIYLSVVTSALLSCRIDFKCTENPDFTPCYPSLFICSHYTIRNHLFLMTPKTSRDSYRLYLFAMLLLNASDCHPNPGPRPVKYPCGICGKACVWSRTVRSVACNSCEKWFHKNCLGMSSAVYEGLNNTEISWYCCGCGLPNFNSSLFENLNTTHLCSTPSQHSSDFHMTTPIHNQSRSSFSPSSSIGSPLHTSSPSSRHKQPITKKKLRILVINFQSILAKREAFWALLEYADPDLVMATETWLNPGIAEREVLPASYRFLARRDRTNSTYGGVAIIGKQEMDSTVIDVPGNTEFVAASIKTTSLKKPVIIGCCYRPTDNNIEYSRDLCQAISDLQAKYKNNVFWFGGDTNLPDVDWSSCSYQGNRYLASINRTFLDTISDTGSEQIVNFPTRNENILDIFCTNRPSLIDKCTPIPGISDHDTVLVDTNIIPKRQKPVQRQIYLWKNADLPSMEKELESYATIFKQQYNTSTPIDTLWSAFKHKCDDTLKKFVPSKMTSARYSQPWCNRDVKRVARRKKRAYKRARASKLDTDWDRYREIQKVSRTTCRNARNSYINNMVTEQGTNKKLFSYVKSMKCDSSGVAPLKKDGVSHSEAYSKASILNEQFSSVFTKEDTDSLPDLGPSSYPDAPPLHIHKNGVRKLLENLNPHKASGPDQISSRFLKEMANPLSSILTIIFQASHNQSCVPSDWKGALVTPLFKKGDRSKASNYRPVSLTSICCKVMEHIVHSHLMTYMERRNILANQQHGFRKKRSCETQLINTIQDLAAGLNNRQQIDAVLLDFSKAFDKVPHERLALKLHHYGVRGQTLGWIQDFLKNRSQQVVLDGKTSSPAPVTSGVPQGTVLGPLLFLVYINDLPSKVTSNARLFADDCLLYRTINTDKDTSALQEDLSHLEVWEKDWQMMFNPDKCEVIRITNKRKIISASYSIHGQTLLQTNKAKYLGVTIDEKLTWNSHIDTVTKKANNTLSFLRRNVSACPKDVKATCYKTLVRPQVEYAASVWDPGTKSNIAKVEAVQRRAARFCHGDYHRTSSVTAMLQDLQWTDLQVRRQQAKAVMMYKIINHLVETDPGVMLIPAGVQTRGNENKFLTPFCNVNAYKYSFYPSGIRLWNNLPADETMAPSVEAFKTQISALLK